MGTFGERLRREREKRGVGLDEIATATKISTRNLRALEDEKFNQLPGGVFNRGFVRAYAKFLGIDEEEVVAQYVAASQDTEEAREEKLKSELAKQEIRKNTDEEREINLEPKSQWTTIAVIVLIAVLAWGGYSVYQKKRAEKSQAPAPTSTVTTPETQTNPASTPTTSEPSQQQPTQSEPSTTQPSTQTTSETTTVVPPKTETQPAVSPNASSGTPSTPAAVSVPVSRPSATPEGTPPINLTMRVKEETWVEVKADGKMLISATLAAGTERSFKANDKVEVKLGKAAGVEMSYNGKVVPSPSNIQDVRKLTFTPSGYE